MAYSHASSYWTHCTVPLSPHVPQWTFKTLRLISRQQLYAVMCSYSTTGTRNAQEGAKKKMQRSRL